MPKRTRNSRGGGVLKSAELIGWAIGGLEREIAATKTRLAALTAEAVRLRRRIGARTATAGAAAPAGAPKRRKRNLSAEARKAISDRMTKRWAEWRKKNKK